MQRILVVLAAVLLLASGGYSYAEELKIGFISLKEVLDNYKKVTEGEEVLLKQAEKKNDEREELVKEIKSLREKIELLKDKQKEQKQQELDEKVKQLQEFTYQSRAGLRQERDEKFREIMKEVKDVIDEYGQSRNYNIILDDTLLLYKNEGLDVTDDIVKMLNQRYKR